PTVSGGIEVPGDHRVDNRALLRALAAACTASGVTFVDGTVAALEPGPRVVLHAGGRIGATDILLAAGTGLPTIEGLERAGIPDVRPVKGTILRLGPAPDRPTGSFLPRTVRGLVRGRAVYLVPRADGSVVVGATVEERGDADLAQAGSVHQLLDDARAIVPAVDDMALLETGVGLRPTTPSHQPFIGWTTLPHVAVATGHFRHGFLLAPITADAVVALLDGEPLPSTLAALAAGAADR
ncbi:MAG TPA: FAD-dependent oxidoreductase, partial [Acidimicrobiales bacterium]